MKCKHLYLPCRGQNPFYIVKGFQGFKICTASYYEMVSKIFRTDAAIYTAVVVAQSTGPVRPKCEFRVLLRRFVAIAWNLAKTSPKTLVRSDLAASPWQRDISHFLSHSAASGEKLNGCHSPPTVLPWFGTLWFLPISKNEIEPERTPVWYHLGDPDRIAERAWHSYRKGLTESVPNMGGDWCLHAGGNYFEDDGGRLALWCVLWFLERHSG
jgi:hypothetical protein